MSVPHAKMISCVVLQTFNLQLLQQDVPVIASIHSRFNPRKGFAQLEANSDFTHSLEDNTGDWHDHPGISDLAISAPKA
jgi:hypothetical protein